MFDQKFITNAMARSAEDSLDRRRLFRAAGAAGIGGAVALLSATSAAADDDQNGDGPDGPSDSAILNFALNLEYLEAEFYLRAVTGAGLAGNLTDGKGKKGGVTGGRQVPFTAGSLVRKYAVEIAADEEAHVRFLRSALGKAAVARPPIDLDASFTAAALAAGLIKAGQTFSPFTDETSFLLGAFIFEDVGVTAYKGAAPFIDNKTYLEAAAGILAVEAYHAGIIRTTMYARDLQAPAQAISDARDSLDGTSDLDQGIGTAQVANLVPADANALAFSRTPAQVLNIAYLTPKSVKSGGFFPDGVNGKLNRSGGS
ncbi:ferritin-like domain-containing protein [Pseudarthrobacter raffinosi]|uniref:ferritin-like domain-containing protein n=1 Tax=Pseudarthrobacter raffinosi TaxID=2953651 RepID=UPI00208EB66A|nr:MULTISPECIES: ferritin-like domain-containing protein [unclassified Pseudarthrobacter]MCO4252946.1 ferritin-like domain-containing protein [Pseudarthrobacter sp. MDT3-9]MCO4265312.1 ferritin-like domain-containing protein [Pseudarthrobacter sp. MDT3-26]